MKEKHIYFSDRKEYYRLKKAGLNFNIRIPIYKTFYINFEIMESKGYIVGSLSSFKYIPLSEAKKIIKINCPAGYTPINFYEAVEYEQQKETIFVVMREGINIIEVKLNV